MKSGTRGTKFNCALLSVGDLGLFESTKGKMVTGFSANIQRNQAEALGLVVEKIYDITKKIEVAVTGNQLNSKAKSIKNIFFHC